MYFMNVAKGQVIIDGNRVNVSMPFAKVDRAKRLVSGFATLDNVDSEDDRVTAAASARAFARARGNLREMHDNIAAGRVVDFREDEFFDKESGETYRGMYVTARVSEGAPNTWIKVLDGTLSGFSIGGEILKASNKMTKDGSKSIREIEDYELVELSLVDNPANPLANINSVEKNTVVSFTKSAGGSVKVGGMVAETVLENVFICPNDSTVIIKTVDEVACPECDTNMEMAGWFEEGPDRSEKVRDIVNKYFSADAREATVPQEGGVEMSKEKDVPEAKETSIVNPSEEFENGDPKDEAVANGEPAAVEVDETADTEEKEPEAETPEEVKDDATEIAKKIDDLHDTIKKTLEEANEATGGRFKVLEDKIDEVHSETAELKATVEKFSQDLDTAKARMADIEKSLSKMNDADAVRKSTDLEDEPVEATNVQKNTTPSWNGAFSGGIARRGSFIDSL